jgi:uncharacterized protein YgfB (UPF0149 family)
MIDYDKSKQALSTLAATEDTSYAHGLLCGYAIVKPGVELKNWLDEILEEYNSKTDDLSILATIFNETLENLSDSTLNFQLLIAGDDNPKQQLITVVSWCGGFLAGLGLAQVNTSDNEVEEIIKGIIEISQIDSEITGSTEDENNIFEVVEFVRMGVLLIQEILNPSKQDFVSPLPIH